jgi:tRNA(fMet)-specific endonuclease VapC
VACADTTILLDLAGRGGKRARRSAMARLRELRATGEMLLTTCLNAAELYVGIYKARDPEEERRRVEGTLRIFGILPFTDAAAREYGRLTAHLQLLGRPAGDMDVLIAATTMAAGEYLLTRNASHFADIPGLEVEEY